MADFSSPLKLCNALLGKSNPLIELFDEMRFDPVYTGNFPDPAENWGGFGLVPLWGTSSGDIAALLPIPGRPMKHWPAFHLPHSGDAGTMIASGFASAVPLALQSLMEGDADFTEEVLAAQKEILSFCRAFGSEKQAGAWLKLVESGESSDEEAMPKIVTVLESANSPMSLQAQATRLADKPAKAATFWRALQKSMPVYLPSWQNLFTAAKVAEKTGIAWQIICADIVFGGDSEIIREAAGWLFKKGKDFSSEPEWPVVAALKENSPVAHLYLAAAENLTAKKQHRRAWNCLKNAAWHMASEMEAMPVELRQLAHACALAMKDRTLAETVKESLPAKPKPQLPEVLAKYAKLSAVKARAEQVQKSAAPLFKAAAAGDAEKIRSLIQGGIPVNAVQKESGKAALHLAAEKGHLNAVKKLLKLGADIHLRTERGWYQPIHSAAEGGAATVIKHLLSAGVKADETTGAEMSALMIACENGHLDAVKTLVTAGANLEHRDSMGETPLLRAASTDRHEIVRYLVTKGADVNRGDSDKTTALHYIAADGDIDMVRLLLKKGAKPLTRDGRGNTPGDWAHDKFPEIEEFLCGKAYKKAEGPAGSDKEEIAAMAGLWGLDENTMTRAEDLNAAFSSLGDEALKAMPLLPRLKILTLSGSPKITDKGIAFLEGCSKLEVLHIGNLKITDAALKSLTRISSLKKIFLEENIFSAAALKQLASLKNLNWLRLNTRACDDSVLAALAPLKELQYFEAVGSSVSDAGMAALSGWKKLKQLDLADTKVTVQGLEVLKNLKNLEWINLEGVKINDGIFTVLKGLSKLNDVKLARTPVTGTGVEQLASLPKMLLLDLSKSKISDACAPGLAKLQQVKVLDLAGTSLTDKAVPSLVKLKKINALIIRGTKITAAGKGKLKRALPAHVSFQWD